MQGDGVAGPELERALKHLFHCFRVANPEVSSKIILLLVENPQGLTVSDIRERLDISYAMVLRIVSELESLGIVETDRLKVKKGRGRARKLVRLNVEGLRRLARDCINLVRLVERLEFPQEEAKSG